MTAEREVRLSAARNARDLEGVAALARVIWNEHYPGIISRGQIDYMLERGYSPAALARDLESGSRYELAREGGRLLGFAAHGAGRTPDEWFLHKLYVDAARRGTGVGWRLCQRAADGAREQGAQRLALRVNRRNRGAVRAYQRMGFAIHEQVVEAIGSGFLMDDHLMALPLYPSALSARIVPFAPEMEERVVALIVGIQRGEFGIDITEEQQPDLRRIPDYYQVGSGNFWVALDGERAVGTASLLDIGSAQTALRKMFVHPDQRGEPGGIARRLLATLLDWARGHGTREIFLGTTPQFLAAHRFYEKNGFSQIPRSALPEAFPVMEVDTRFYRRRVEPGAAGAPRGPR